MLMKRDESGENSPSREELEGMSFDELSAGLTDGTITRAKAIKLAGAALLGGALTVLWADEADAANKKKRRRRKRRRRKAQVTPNPVTVLPALLTVINPSDDKPLTIAGFQVLDGDGDVIHTGDLLPDVTIPVDDPATIQPENVGQVTITVTDPLVVANAEGLRLIDGRGMPITVVDDNGDVVGDGAIDLVL